MRMFGQPAAMGECLRLVAVAAFRPVRSHGQSEGEIGTQSKSGRASEMIRAICQKNSLHLLHPPSHLDLIPLDYRYASQARHQRKLSIQ
jgi:hypothetical protein